MKIFHLILGPTQTHIAILADEMELEQDTDDEGAVVAEAMIFYKGSGEDRRRIGMIGSAVEGWWEQDVPKGHPGMPPPPGSVSV